MDAASSADGSSGSAERVEEVTARTWAAGAGAPSLRPGSPRRSGAAFGAERR